MRGPRRHQGLPGLSPGPDDIALVVEVSEASLADDRKMAQVYGNAGIPIYWIINLVDGHVEVYSNPVPAGYAAMDVLMPGHVLSVVIDNVEVGRIRWPMSCPDVAHRAKNMLVIKHAHSRVLLRRQNRLRTPE